VTPNPIFLFLQGGSWSTQMQSSLSLPKT